ncbi:smalltalk protein [Phocaeicola sp.]
MKKSNWRVILKIIIAIATSIASAIGVTSCIR